MRGTLVSTDIRTYGNWQPPRDPGLLGLGRVGTALLAVGLFAGVIALMLTGNLLIGGSVFLLFAIVLALMMRKDQHGRSALQRTAEHAVARSARRRGSHLQRGGPLGRTNHGSCTLPGLLAQTRLWEGRDSWDRPFAVVEYPSTGDFVVVFEAEPDGVSLTDLPQVNAAVADFGQFLQRLSDHTDIVAAQVTIETAPETGDRLRREVAAVADPNAPALAREVMAEVCQEYPTGSAAVRAYASITFSALNRVGGRRRSRDEMLRDLATRLPAFTSRLEQAGAGAARPLPAQALTDLVRIAYDPSTQRDIELATNELGASGIRWDDAGPSGHQADWDCFRHDGYTSISWQMSLPPTGLVQSDVLDDFLRPDTRIARKRVTLLYRPISAAAAATIVENDVNNAGFNLGSTNRQATARAHRAVKLAVATAQEEAGGASLVDFGLVATATVAGHDAVAIDDARAAVENTGAAARLRLRVATNMQDTAFAAALPVGLVTAKHLVLPQEFHK